MQRSLGEKIGEGHFSDVHAWAPGQVVKLFKSDVPARVAVYEAYMTQAVFEAGGPALEVLGTVKVDGRRGFVLPRLHGPTLRASMDAGDVSLREAAEILARLGLSVHDTPPPPEALSLRDYMEASLKVSDGALPSPLARDVMALIERLSPDDRLSHCDLHPSNVILTPEGPRLIDWTGVRRGGAAYDLACAHFLRAELQPPVLGDPERQLAFDVAMRTEYARLTGQDPDVLMTRIEAHMPIVRAFFLLGGRPRPETRERLLGRLERDFAGGAP